MSIELDIVLEAIKVMGSQKALAKYMGVREATVSKWANARGWPAPGNLAVLEEILWERIDIRSKCRHAEEMERYDD